MKTTNICFKEQIQTHILECLDDVSNYEGLRTTVIEFNNWYGEYEQKRTPNKQTAFISFLQGLPSCLNLPFTYNDINEKMKEWFEKCGETYNGKLGFKESHLYYALIYREFRTLCKAFDIEF